MHDGAAREVVMIAAGRWDTAALADLLMDLETAEPFRERVTEAGLRELLRESIDTNLSLAKDHVRGGHRLDAAALERPRHYASALAMLGVSRESLLGSYRASFSTVWTHWSAAVEEVLIETDLEGEVQRAALVLAFERILSFNSQVLAAVESSYQEQEELLKRSGARIRLDAVRRILDDPRSVEGEDHTSVLQYDVGAHHLAVMALDISELTAQRLSARLRAAGGATHALTIRDSLSEIVIWLGRPGPWDRMTMQSVVAALQEWGGRAATSEPSAGAWGMRRTYDQLQQIAMVRRQWTRSPAVLPFSDVSLEALMLSGSVDIRRFVQHELGSLAASDSSAERMRETLLAWYEAGSHVATAESLHLHEHTVRNRLAKIESELGHPIGTRRLELHLALRLQRVLGGGGRMRMLRDGDESRPSPRRERRS